MIVDNSFVEEIKNSNFESCGNENSQYGGGIHIEKSNTTIMDSTFINNTGKIGAAIHGDCDLTSQ